MARAAVLGRLIWRVATVAQIRPEAATAHTIVLDVPGWPGHIAGQHVDVRLTAADGYAAQRSYSIASVPRESTVELTVQRVPDGEVSAYLVDVAEPGDQFELRGPIGGYFTWEPSDRPDPVQLVAGGSGIVPLMAMIRWRSAAASSVPFRLLYSVREPGTVIYAAELARLATDGVAISYLYTRRVPADWGEPPGRLDAARLARAAWPAASWPQCFVCGPTGFVEAAADLLVSGGHPPQRIKTERFGPTGG